MNLYKIMGYTTHKLHFAFNFKDSNFNYRDIPISFTCDLLTMLSYLALKDDTVKEEQPNPFSDGSNYLKLLLNAPSFLFLDEIPLAIPHFDELMRAHLNPIFGRLVSMEARKTMIVAQEKGRIDEMWNGLIREVIVQEKQSAAAGSGRRNNVA